MNSPSSASAFAISKVPTLSMLAAMIGMPVQVRRLWRNLKVRSRLTCERLPKVERFGRIKTSLNPSLRSASMRIQIRPYKLNRWR